MPELEPEFKRVNMDVEARAMPELLGLLGDFVARNSIVISITDLPRHSQAQFMTEILGEPSGYVTWINPEDSTDKFAIITKDHLVDFWIQYRDSKFARQGASKVFNSFEYHHRFNGDDTFEKYFYRDNHIEGIRANRLIDLILAKPHEQIEGLGETSKQLLSLYAELLIREGIIEMPES